MWILYFLGMDQYPPFILSQNVFSYMCHRNLNFFLSCPPSTSICFFAVFAEKIRSTFNNDATKLQLKMQPEQHAHEIKNIHNVQSVFLERSHHYPHPPNYPAPVQPPSLQPPTAQLPTVQPPSMQSPHLYNQRQPPPQHFHISPLHSTWLHLI